LSSWRSEESTDSQFAHVVRDAGAVNGSWASAGPDLEISSRHCDIVARHVGGRNGRREGGENRPIVRSRESWLRMKRNLIVQRGGERGTRLIATIVATREGERSFFGVCSGDTISATYPAAFVLSRTQKSLDRELLQSLLTASQRSADLLDVRFKCIRDTRYSSWIPNGISKDLRIDGRDTKYPYLFEKPSHS